MKVVCFIFLYVLYLDVVVYNVAKMQLCDHRVNAVLVLK